MKIEERVLQTASSVFNVSICSLNLIDNKETIELWDSIGHLQLIMGLEAEFDIKFKTSEIQEIKSFKDCIRVINIILSKA